MFAAQKTKQADTDIKYVGGYVEGFVGQTTDKTITLTSLTGGLASQPSADDFVIVYFGTSSTADRNLVVSGYTEVVELWANDDSDTNLAVAYKFMTATPDTSITLTGGTLNIAEAGAVYISVWRNVNTTTPLDVTQTTATGTNTVLADPPAITPVTLGSVIVSGAAGAHDKAGAQTYSSSNLTGFLSVGADDSTAVTIGGGYNIWTTGTFNPAQFTFSNTDGGKYSYAAVTLALRKK